MDYFEEAVLGQLPEAAHTLGCRDDVLDLEHHEVLLYMSGPVVVDGSSIALRLARGLEGSRALRGT